MLNIRENITLFLKVLERYNLNSIKYIHYVGNQDCNSAGKSLSLVESVGYFYYLLSLFKIWEWIHTTFRIEYFMYVYAYVCMYIHTYTSTNIYL